MADGGEDSNMRRAQSKKTTVRPKGIYEETEGTRKEIKSVEAKDDDSSPDEANPKPISGDYGQLQGIVLPTKSSDEPDYENVEKVMANRQSINNNFSCPGVSCRNNVDKPKPLVFETHVEVQPNSSQSECPQCSAIAYDVASPDAGNNLEKPGILLETGDFLDVSKKVQEEVFITPGSLREDLTSTEKRGYGLKAYSEGLKYFRNKITEKLRILPSITKEQFSWTVDKIFSKSMTVFYEHAECREREAGMLEYYKFYRQELKHQVEKYELQVKASLANGE